MSVGKEQSLKGLTFKFSEKPILFVFLVSRTRETNDIVLYIAVTSLLEADHELYVSEKKSIDIDNVTVRLFVA